MSNQEEVAFIEESMAFEVLMALGEESGMSPRQLNDEEAQEVLDNFDYQKADWVLAMIADSMQKIQAAQTTHGKRCALLAKAYNERLEKYAAAYKDTVNPYENQIKYLWMRYGQAVQRVVSERLKKSKRKTEKINGIQIGTRQIPSKTFVEDETSVLNWAYEHLPEAVNIKESIILDKVKAHMKENGEIVPGIQTTDEYNIPVVKWGNLDVTKLLGEMNHGETTDQPGHQEQSSGDDIPSV